MSAYGTPCAGELQFWAVMRAQMAEQTKQLKRIADALETWTGARPGVQPERWLEPQKPTSAEGGAK